MLLTVWNQKLNVGGTAEKIVSAFDAVSSNELDENADLEKCESAAKDIGKMEKDVEDACNEGATKCILILSYLFLLSFCSVFESKDAILVMFCFSDLVWIYYLLLVGEPRREMLEKDLKEEETILKQCIERLKAVEQNRAALVSQLKEALKEQVQFYQQFSH